MATYIILGNFTELGIKNVKGSPERAKAFESAASQKGVKVKSVYWTIGQYDIAAIAEAPNDETITAALLALGRQGNVRTQTLRAFDASEMSRILEKV